MVIWLRKNVRKNLRGAEENDTIQSTFSLMTTEKGEPWILNGGYPALLYS